MCRTFCKSIFVICLSLRNSLPSRQQQPANGTNLPALQMLGTLQLLSSFFSKSPQTAQLSKPCQKFNLLITLTQFITLSCMIKKKKKKRRGKKYSHKQCSYAEVQNLFFSFFFSCWQLFGLPKRRQKKQKLVHTWVAKRGQKIQNMPVTKSEGSYFIPSSSSHRGLRGIST